MPPTFFADGKSVDTRVAYITFVRFVIYVIYLCTSVELGLGDHPENEPPLVA
jgi:hypothetical protein